MNQSVSYIYQLEQENKRLKEKIETLKGIGNSFMKFSEHYKEESDNLKEELGQIKSVPRVLTTPENHAEIIKENKQLKEKNHDLQHFYKLYKQDSLELTSLKEAYEQLVKSYNELDLGHEETWLHYDNLKQKQEQINYATLHAGCTVRLPDCIMCKIQQILKGNK